jgi:putative endonuclease
MFWAYAIYNKGRNKIYIGQTENLHQRLRRHNGLLKNKRKSFTSKNSGLWEIVHTESFLTRSEAMHREKELKSYKGREFIKNLISDQYPPVAQW